MLTLLVGDYFHYLNRFHWATCLGEAGGRTQVGLAVFFNFCYRCKHTRGTIFSVIAPLMTFSFQWFSFLKSFESNKKKKISFWKRAFNMGLGKNNCY